MNTPLIVMLSGWAGSGKDAAASILVSKYGFQRVAFADALKVDAVKRTGIPLHMFHLAAKNDPLQEACPVFPTARTPRDILLQLALQMRAENPDIYADSIICQIAESTSNHQFVISDWRYRREANRIQEMLPTARLVRVRIQRPGVIASRDPSEHDLDNEPMDLIIENIYDLSYLQVQLRDKLIHYIHSNLSSIIHGAEPPNIHGIDIQ